MPFESFVRAYPPAVPPDGPCIRIVVQKGDVLVAESATGTQLPRDVVSAANDPLFLGTLDGVPCLAEEIAVDAPVPAGLQALGLRALYGRVPDDEFGLAGYASQLLHWRRTSRFCPACGHATITANDGWSRKCPNCGFGAYPPVSPAVLALVHDGGDRILLASKPGWGARYSILAGFVEPGESLEECVAREVLEESGVRVDEIVYRGSQPWPFPHQVMIGFTARHVSGDIVIDADELERADWFRFDALPELPPPLSLSRQLIDAWVASRQK